MAKVREDLPLKTFAFMDTNVFIHFAFFRDVDWSSELGSHHVTLVLPPVVLQELDKRKWAGTRREKERAKTVLRAFRELGLSTSPVELRARVSVMALDDEPDDAFLARYRLQPRAADDRLLASAIAFKELRKDARVLILTDDTGLTIRAPTRQMEVVVPSERLELADEPDETERALESVRRELAAAKNAAPKLVVAFDVGDHLELESRLASALAPVTYQKLLANWRQRHPRASGLPGSIRLPGGGVVDTSVLSGLPGYLSPAQADRRNAAIDQVFEKYRDYLDNWPSLVNSLSRCVKISLELRNDGTAPADDVHLLLWTEARGIWREKFPTIAEPPEVPKARSPYDFALAASLPRFDPTDFRHRDDPINGPNISEEEPVQAEFEIKRVKHHVPCALPKVYFQFGSDEDVASFNVDYRLVAANLREPQIGQLNVKITLRDRSPAPSPENFFGDDEGE